MEKIGEKTRSPDVNDEKVGGEEQALYQQDQA